MRATRGAWALDYMGHPGVRILDGGLKCAERPEQLVTAATPYAPVDFKGAVREELDRVARLYRRVASGRAGVQIFDVRSDEEYFGERVRAKHARRDSRRDSSRLDA